MKILNYKESSHDPKIQAIFDIDLENGITYPNLRLRRGKNNHLFLDRPSYVKGEVDGVKEWGKYPEMSKERWDDFVSKAKVALEPFITF